MSAERESEELAEAASGESRRRDGLLTTGDMARLSQNTLRTVRFYEESGLLRPLQRTDGGHRLFARSELTRLRFVSDLRAAGLPLELIRRILDAKQHGSCGAEAARDVLGELDRQIQSMSDQVALLRRVLTELERARDVLVGCSGCTHDEHFPNRCSECPVMNEPAELPDAVSVLWGISR